VPRSFTRETSPVSSPTVPLEQREEKGSDGESHKKQRRREKKGGKRRGTVPHSRKSRLTVFWRGKSRADTCCRCEERKRSHSNGGEGEGAGSHPPEGKGKQIALIRFGEKNITSRGSVKERGMEKERYDNGKKEKEKASGATELERKKGNAVSTSVGKRVEPLRHLLKKCQGVKKKELRSGGSTEKEEKKGGGTG